MCLIPAFRADGPHIRRLADNCYATNVMDDLLWEKVVNKDNSILGQFIKLVDVDVQGKKGISFHSATHLDFQGTVVGTQDGFNGPLMVFNWSGSNEPKLKFDVEYASQNHFHTWVQDEDQLIIESIYRGYSFKRYFCSGCCAIKEE